MANETIEYPVVRRVEELLFLINHADIFENRPLSLLMRIIHKEALLTIVRDLAAATGAHCTVPQVRRHWRECLRDFVPIEDATRTDPETGT